MLNKKLYCAVLFLGVAALITAVFAYVLDRRGEDVSDIYALDKYEAASDDGGVIDINTATAEELTELDGIGEITAEKIVEYREDNGGFSDVEELENVNGIGSGKLEEIRDKICVSGE